MRWSIVIVAAVATAPAAASPGDAPWDGAVFAGPTSPHPANIAENPAAMLLASPGGHFFVGGVGALDQLGFDRRIVDDSGATQGGPSLDGSTTSAGGHVGAMWVRSAGMIAIIGRMPVADETVAGEAALAYHTRGSRTRNLDWTSIAAAYRVGSRVAFGLGGTYGSRHSVLRFARDTALEAGRDGARGTASDCGGAPCGLENPAATQLWTIDVRSDRFTLDNLTLSGGLLIYLPGEMQFGITYQRPWNLSRIDRDGIATVVAAPRDGGAVHSGEATVFDQLPQLVRMGSRSRTLPRWDLVGELRWRFLGRASVDDVRVYGGDLASADVPAIYPRPRGLRNAVALEVGLEEIDDGQLVRVGARLGVDTGVVDGEHISPRAPWGRQVTAGGGAQLRLGRWVLQASYGVGFQPSEEASPGAFRPIDRLDCVDSGHDAELPACATVRAGYGAPTAAGSYTRWSHVGRLSLRFEVP